MTNLFCVYSRDERHVKSVRDRESPAAQGPSGGDRGCGDDVRFQGLRATTRQPHRRTAHTQVRIYNICIST